MKFYAFSIIVCFLLPIASLAQFCTGTLGDNIFLEGNFGSATANLLSPNPNIAPGYSYTFSVPPLDGEYVITNSTTNWSGLFNSWLSISDNSTDPSGYMMVVNASNAPGLFYEQTVSGLCENTLYEFSADIINLIKIGTPDHIDPDVSFLLDGVELFSTGNIPKTNNWTSYGFTFTTSLGGTQSLTLSLRNNAPGGNGNDLAIDNISFRACGPETSISPAPLIINLCEDNTPIELQANLFGNQYINPAFQWQKSFDLGITWIDIVGANQDTYTPSQLTAGNYYYRFLVADGSVNLGSDKCRVNSNAKIINVFAKEIMQSDSICEGFELMIGNSIYTETGIYVDTFVNFLGCDSILITDLTVLLDSNFQGDYLVTPPCQNESNGSIYIENVRGSAGPFNFVFDGVDFGATNLFTDLSAGQTYTISIQDYIGCSIELSVFVENASDLTLELGGDRTIELGETVEIFPIYNFSASDFIWQTVSPINCIDLAGCEDLNFAPTINQHVILELYTESGCSISDSIFIEVIEVRKVWLPNAFTPNGNGLNDYFTVFGKTPNVQLVEELKIFDGWGGLIFERQNFPPNVSQNGWDGTLNGKPAPLGVYVYTATIRFADGQVLRYSGDFCLVN